MTHWSDAPADAPALANLGPADAETLKAKKPQAATALGTHIAGPEVGKVDEVSSRHYSGRRNLRQHRRHNQYWSGPCRIVRWSRQCW